MLTRKDVERIAQVFRCNRPPTSKKDRRHLDAWYIWTGLQYDMCVELSAINPRFDVEKFKEACDP